MTNKLPEIGKRYKEKHTNKIVQCVISSFNSPINIHFETDDGEEVPFNLTMWDRLFEELPNQEPTTEESSIVGKIISDPDYLELLTAAKFVGDFFKLRDIKEWEFMDLQSRWKKSDISKKETTDKVQEALDALKYALRVEYTSDNFALMMLKDSVKDFVKILEENTPLEDQKHTTKTHQLDKNTPALACSNQQETPSSSIVEHASKSIWKPISEGKNNHFCNLIIRTEDGEVTLGGFNNSRNMNKEVCTLTDFINHQESLEKRIEKLEQKEGKK